MKKTILTLTIAALAATSVLATDRGPQPKQPRDGWIDSMTSVKAAEAWGKRAYGLNNDLDWFWEQERLGTAEFNPLTFHNILDRNCQGVTGEAFAGMGGLNGIIHGGLCSQYKTDLKAFTKTGKTENFAKCWALTGAYSNLNKLQTKPHWWYVGDEGARLLAHLKRIGNTEFRYSESYEPGGKSKLKGKFHCPIKEKK